MEEVLRSIHGIRRCGPRMSASVWLILLKRFLDESLLLVVVFLKLLCCFLGNFLMLGVVLRVSRWAAGGMRLWM